MPLSQVKAFVAKPLSACVNVLTVSPPPLSNKTIYCICYANEQCYYRRHPYRICNNGTGNKLADIEDACVFPYLYNPEMYYVLLQFEE